MSGFMRHELQVLENGEVVATHLIDAPRDCKTCGWELPDNIMGYIGPCPVCERRANNAGRDH